MIIDLSDNRKYIGKKNYRGRGKKNKDVPSNWKTYCSSSEYLTNLIKDAKDKDRFKFVILGEYNTVGGLSFAETWSQVFCETPSNNKEFMNRFIDKVSWKVNEKVKESHKRRLRYFLRKYRFRDE